ncbi:kinase-like protein [Choiromyces venosus 120613-1]|uniref:Kinase-like protein n=1 Tax=Choiromyces venosus 120613-1 TaxID=1336337 RepID=A0A3N4JF96_9PEZI|nr:kinase-like protein [Choiromyces venosus 120613-1]
MFSNALKSFTSNITSNYTLSPSPTGHAGPWKIYDAKKKKSPNQAVSVFVFERKSLDQPGGSSGGLSLRGSSSRDGLRAAQDEVVDRLKKEASLLARLRHPSILELVEPVEETRGGGLMFATEPVMTSLAVLLAEKDEEERSNGGRYVVGGGNGGRRRREVEIDELEIQKGILQIAKGLEFLHESAALIHGNLTPESVMLNVKSDWKLTSFSFTVTSVKPPLPAPYDPRLPPFVQLSLDYASPDLILDQNLTPSADLFSLGLLIVALYNHPHRSPLETHHTTSTYRRLLTSASTTPNSGNNYLSSRPLPRPLVETLLSRLLTRRPAGRVTAREFQQSPYFDNILVSTLRFLESLPAKTPSEKSAFMRGLPKVLPQFPRRVLEKKILPGLVEELRDGSMLALVLPNIFLIVENASVRLFSEKVLPKLKEVFVNHVPSTTEHKTAAAKIAERERETGREGGLTVLLSNLNIIKDKTTAKEFKEDILPVHHAALESQTHALQDLALRSIPTILPKLDFPTLKNDLFPVVASVFTKTSSLGIKIRGLEAFKVLCSPAAAATSDAPELDKYTIQEKLIPLLRGIKTKEPAVSMAALDVFKVIGKTCDREVVAMEILPCLWSMSFGPLLGVDQFMAFMEVVRQVSSRIEAEQIRKLQELRTEGGSGAGAGDILSFGGMPGMSSGITGGGGGGGDDNFENLVFGRGGGNKSPPVNNGGFDAPWNSMNAGGSGTITAQKSEPKFSWSTPSSTTNLHSSSSFSGGVLQPQQQTRAMTPEAKMSFQPLTPTSASHSASNSMNTNAFSNLNLGSGFGSTTSLRSQPPHSQSASNTSSGGIDWSSAATRQSFPSTTSNTNTQANSLWNTPPLKPAQSPLSGGFKPPVQQNQQQNHPTILYGQTRQQPAPTTSTGAFSGFMIPPPPGVGTSNIGGGTLGGGGAVGGFTLTLPTSMNKSTEKKGLDAYESLL